MIIHKKRWVKTASGGTIFHTACGLTMGHVEERKEISIARLKIIKQGEMFEVNCEDCLRIANLEKIRPQIHCHQCGVNLNPAIPKREKRYPNSRLSGREAEVAAHMILGKTSPEIGMELHICDKTVKYHLTAIYRKLAVGGRLKVSAAYYAGTLQPTAQLMIADYLSAIKAKLNPPPPVQEVPKVEEPTDVELPSGLKR